MAKIDEIKKKLANNNLISIENCKPYSVPEILQEHTIKINELISKQEDAYVLNITMYGCVGDYKTINSKQLQLAIDNAVEQKIYEIIVPSGVYRLDTPVNLKGVKLIGQGSNIPFMTWDYTRPNGNDDFEKYVSQCKGSVFIVTGEIGFTGEVRLEKVGIMGNRRKQHTAIKCDKALELKEVNIGGFGYCGIDMTDGCINPYLVDCKIEQNQIGIVIDNQRSNGYTGETNRLYCHRCSFNRNEDYGVYGTLMGRSVHFNECTFESIGEPSDSSRFKPNSFVDVKCAIELYLKSTNSGMTTGDIKIHNCYIEETYGFVKIHASDVATDISIKNNFWRPYDQNHYSCFVGLNGYFEDVYITGNNCYTKHHYFYSSNYNIRNIVSDIPQLCDKYPSILNIPYKGNIKGQYVNIASTQVYDEKTFPSGFITRSSYDNKSFESRELVGSKGVTYFWIDNSKLDGFDMGVQGSEFTGSHTGKLLIINNQPVGIIYSHTNSLFSVIGDKTGVDIGNGNAKIQRLGGFTTLRADGVQMKVVYDMDGTPIPFGK